MKVILFGLNKLVTEDEKLKVANLFFHASDLSGSAKNIKLAARWTKLVNQEFMAQVIYF